MEKSLPGINEESSSLEEQGDAEATSQGNIESKERDPLPAADRAVAPVDEPMFSDGTLSNSFIEDPRVGVILDKRYRVFERLAEGSMGAVYRSELIQLGKPVAIKFMHGSLLFDEPSRARFFREAAAMSKLSHPHCVSVIDYGIDGSPYIVMDYVTGKSLASVIGQEEISFGRAIRIALQILAGLAHAHGQGIIHRDIKPENIILNEAAGTGEQVHVIDFSIAKMAGNSGLTMTGEILGTPSFMSPEQSRGEDVDPRADLYSVGVVLFELLTGQNPFPGETIKDVMRMHRETTAPTLGAFLPSAAFSPEIEAVLKTALAKSPEERFSSAFDFIDALSNVPEAEDVSEVLRAQTSSSEVIKPLPPSAVETVYMPPEEYAAVVQQQNWKARFHFPGRLFATRKVMIVCGISAVAVALITALMVVWISLSEEPPPKEQKVISPIQKPEPRRVLPNPKDVIVAESLKKAKHLLATGQTELAISALQKIRANDPRSAEAPYLLGNLYSDKGWWAGAIARYETAIELNPEYGRDPILNENLIRALGGEKGVTAARKFILNKLGQNAIPHLRKALSAGDLPMQVRRRAVNILLALSEGQPTDPNL